MVGDYKYNLAQDYFQWLCDMVHIDQGTCTYHLLARDLHRKPFIFSIERDENRAGDGLELREEFVRDNEYASYGEIDGECSVFEMIIALARRMDYATSDPYDLNDISDRTSYWFWEIMDNLGLSRFSDDVYVEEEGDVYVDWIVDNLLQRQYDEDGLGGMFPLNDCYTDQRDLEIWDQMNAYLIDRGMV